MSEAFALQCFFNNLCDFVVANTLRLIHDHDGGVFVVSPSFDPYR